MFQHHREGSRQSRRRSKCITLIQNGYPDRLFKYQLIRPTNREDLIKVVEKNWGIGKYKNIKLFTMDGIEYFDEDLLYLRDGDRLYVSKGQQFDSNRNFGEYEIVRKLGEGGFGHVELARSIITGEYAAIKILKPDKNTTSTDIDMIFREAQNLKVLNHPNIVKIINCYALSDMKVVMVMEFLEGGELLALLKQKKRFTEEQARNYLKQIVHAVSYCHRRGIIHRDLKLENILLNKEKVVKVADFGISGVANRFNPEVDWGTLRYMCPQVLSGKEKRNSSAVDVWACGIILYYMVIGNLPFTGTSSSEIIRSIIQDPVPFPEKVKISIKFKSLVERLLDKNPQQRMAMNEVEDDPWMLNHDSSPSSFILKTTPSEEIALQINDIRKDQRKSLNLAKKHINVRIPKRLEKERCELAEELRGYRFQKRTIYNNKKLFPEVRNRLNAKYDHEGKSNTKIEAQQKKKPKQNILK